MIATLEKHVDPPAPPKKTVNIIQAEYRPTHVMRFDGNPFIEALPQVEDSKQEFITMLANDPPAPTGKTRKLGEITRTMELSTIADLVLPFPEYGKVGIAVATMLRDTYVARNPLSPTDRQRRHALATRGEDGICMPADWKSSAGGYTLMAISGMGKTTFARAFFLRYPQVIEHTSYQGQPLKCLQVVYLILRIPHDGTLRSLCVQFFAAIDRLLGTKYARQARAIRNIAPMVDLMNLVASTVSLGFIVIDEFQNLRSATAANAEIVLNMFSEIIEELGISLLLLATPAVQPVIERSVRNGRKLMSNGETVIPAMKPNDGMWTVFCEKYWEYSYVKKKGRLTPDVKKAWYKASGGNSSFAAMAFMLSQRSEIGGREIIDETSFARTAATDMAFLQPAIKALISGKPAHLRAFDDLVFSKKYLALRKQLGIEDPPLPNGGSDEFDEMDSAGDQRGKPKRSRGKSVATDGADDFLPMEDPLELA